MMVIFMIMTMVTMITVNDDGFCVNLNLKTTLEQNQINNDDNNVDQAG